MVSERQPAGTSVFCWNHIGHNYPNGIGIVTDGLGEGEFIHRYPTGTMWTQMKTDFIDESV
jgi:hypothetical protein